MDSEKTNGEGEPSFVSKVVELKDDESGDLERKVVVTINDTNLVLILRQSGLLAESKRFEEHPEFDVTELIALLPQLRTFYENQYAYLGDENPKTRKAISSFIKFLEAEYGGITKRMEDMIASGFVTFNNLWFLFPVGALAYTFVEEQTVAFEVTAVKYQKTIMDHSFSITGEVIQSDGKKFFTARKTYSIPFFDKTVKIGSLNVQPLPAELKEKLEVRGRLFEKYGLGSHYLNYKGTIFRRNWFYNVKYESSGRVMVDGVSFARMNPDYPRAQRGHESYDELGNPIETGLKSLPENKLYMTWPFLPLFSFASKKWGEGVVANLSEIEFDSQAFERLVLPAEKKRIIKALVEHCGQAFTDIITGKGGGIIFLLHGSPGVGKTLTAESISELLRRPLYSISVGELGTSTVDLEKRLREILEVSQTWKALVLIDEADIFLESRTEKDIERNAMVGVFLRLLEYHQGILFLTTNRVKVFDEAFQSRISIAIKYEDLSYAARVEIWNNFLKLCKIELSTTEVEQLAQHPLNGRQIKNTVRLAQTLAFSEGVTPAFIHFERTINLALDFKKI